MHVQCIRERTRIRLIEIEILSVDSLVLVPRLLRDQVEHVGVTVPATQRRKTPILRHAGDGAVVVIKSVVGRAAEVFGDGAADQDGEHLIVLTVGVVLVEGQQHQGVLCNVWDADKFGDGGALPGRGKGDVGVMGVVGHVGGDEGPLRECLLEDVIL